MAAHTEEQLNLGGYWAEFTYIACCEDDVDLKIEQFYGYYRSLSPMIYLSTIIHMSNNI